MTLLDKAKVAAEKAAARAQQGVQQGQAKIDAIQTKRRADALLHDLGVAYYAEQRQGAGHEAVDSALRALDAHAVEHGGVDTDTDAESGDGNAPA
jgi:hypothetical protein